MLGFTSKTCLLLLHSWREVTAYACREAGRRGLLSACTLTSLEWPRPSPSHRPCQEERPSMACVPCLVHWTDLLTSPEGPGWGKAGRVLGVKKKTK